MKRMVRVIAIAAAALCAAGCASSGISKEEQEISAGFVREVTRNAVNNALVAPKLARYVEKFRADHGGRNPVLKFATAVNETRNPELDTSVVYDEFAAVLSDADKMEVTRAEGAERIPEIADSRDAAFDPDTVSKRGSLVAANLVMRLKATSAESRERDGRMIAYAFTIEIVEVESGISLWNYRRSMGFVSK
jgi:PBP1b-binding outer membrane lipoprotein LpoB